MKTLKSWVIVIFIVHALFCTLTAQAAEVTDAVRSTMDKVLNLLQDPSLKGPENAVRRREKLLAIVRERFDFTELSRLALGVYWKERTIAEKKEFVDLFARFLEHLYVDQIEAYKGEKILYESEKRYDNRVVVKTGIVTTKGETEVDFKMLKEEKGWMIYDIVIDGVSILRIYRSQFQNIIRKSSFQELVRKLKAKVAEQ